MSDPFESLRHLPDEGLPVTPLPAPEVRHRGDRMRRRRTILSAAGTAAAVAVIASGGLLVGQNVNGTTPAPAPATQRPSTTAPAGGWVTEIPADFPLDLGLPAVGGDIPPRQPVADVESWFSVGCEQDQAVEADARRVDGRGIIADAPASRHVRELALYEDHETAVAAGEQLTDLAGACGETGLLGIPDGVQRWATSQVDDAAHPYLLVQGRAYSGDTRVPGTTSTLFVTVGNAVLSATATGESAADGLDHPEGRELAEHVQQMADAMCVFAADRCGEDTAVATPVLGPDGYGPVTLGMTREEAEATGAVTFDRIPRNASCATGTLTDGGGVYLSNRHGVVAIWLAKDMSTAEGIRLGSSEEEVLVAYPDGANNLHQYWTVPVSGTAEYQIAMPEGVVEELMLADEKQDCFG